MKLPALLALIVPLSVATAFVVTRTLSAGAARLQPEIGAGERVSELEEALVELRREQGDLSRAVAMLHTSPLTIEPSTTRVDESEIEAALQEWLNARGLAVADQEPALSEEAELLVGLELAQILEIIRSTPLMGSEQSELWQRIRESGRIDEVIAELERQAAADPTSPDAQLAVGGALLQKLMAEPSPASMFELAEAADEAFDRALELDETHWVARFTKAIALSRQPAFMGKSGEAIDQFEILVEQQSHGAVLPEHAQVHLYLGSLYQQTGSGAKALEAWRRGLALFPDDPRLRAQVELLDASRVE